MSEHTPKAPPAARKEEAAKAKLTDNKVQIEDLLDFSFREALAVGRVIKNRSALGCS
jgi:hypothetical protein